VWVLPSISEQLKTKLRARKTIDAMWLKILGYKSLSNETLDNLYDSMLKEFEIIGKVMGESARVKNLKRPEKRSSNKLKRRRIRN
jgi:hypothetical protein